jgi:hypothetical protein
MKHYPALNNAVTRSVEATLYAYKEGPLAPGPQEVESDLVVLVGMHHKTGRW